MEQYDRIQFLAKAVAVNSLAVILITFSREYQLVLRSSGGGKPGIVPPSNTIPVVTPGKEYIHGCLWISA